MLLIFLYVVVLVPDFFSTRIPSAPRRAQAFIPAQTIHLFDDGRFAPWVPAIVGKRNPTTLRMEWTTDAKKKVPVALLRAGLQWKVFGLFPTNRHLIGRSIPTAAHLPAGHRPARAAISGRASCTARRPR